MTTYHFRVDGGFNGDETPFDVDLNSLAEARLEAVELAAQLMRSEPERLIEVGDGCVICSDADHLDLFRVDVGLFYASAFALAKAT